MSERFAEVVANKALLATTYMDPPITTTMVVVCILLFIVLPIAAIAMMADN